MRDVARVAHPARAIDASHAVPNAPRWTARVAASDSACFGLLALLFAASVTATIIGCRSMTAMGELPMSGGWSMSMAWVRMCGQTWSGVAASFLGMWIVMMVAMMLPSLLPTLWRYRAAAMKIPVSVAAMLTTLGYFAVWTALGAGVFLAGATLAALAMQLPALSRAVPVASSFVVLCGGVFQFSAWKARLLSSCRHSPEFDAGWQASAGAAGRLGLRLGCRCTGSCAGFTAMLLVGGVMDMRVMAVVGAAITAERLAPSALRVPQAIGVVAIVLGLISLSLT